MSEAMRRKILITLSVAVLLLAAGLTGGSLYLIDYSLRPDNRGKDLEASEAYMRKTYPQLNSWLDSLRQVTALRDTFIYAADNETRLHAYYIRADRPTAQTAVIVHGYTDNAIRMFHIGYLYSHDLHYNVLLPDLRYSGLSDGDAFQMGWFDRLDVGQWIRTAPQLFGDSLKVVVHGISMGAATTMMTSGEEQPSYVKCYVEDCGYTSVWDQFAKELKEQFGLPTFPLLHVASRVNQLQNGWNFAEASALEQVKKCTRPMLFIHGDKDDFVPTWMVYKVYEAKPGIKELWVVPDAAHAVSYRDNTAAYTHTVGYFVNKYCK